MLIPLRHENMEARRWPVITIGLIVLNTVIFVITNAATDRQPKEAKELGTTKVHIILLASAHPELTMSDDERDLVDNFKKQNPTEWEHLASPMHDVIDGWDAQMRLKEDPQELQADMDTLAKRYVELKNTTISGQYAFVPAHPRLITYLTANFLHAGWMHLIGNMWFLWLAGFVLEDVWGRPLYLAFYLIAGVAALQFHAWTNPGSIVPCVGASGAVAGLMGAFLARFPKMKIEMGWIWWFSLARLLRTGSPFRMSRFWAAAYWLLPIWLLTEVLSGTLFGRASGVAHWAHVGGFLFGAICAFALRYTGFEAKVHEKVEKEQTWKCDPELERANQLMETGNLDEAVTAAKNHIAANPNSIDAWNVLRQVYWRRQEMTAYQEASAKTCELHLRAKNADGAWEDYEDFRKAGGEKLPAASWFEICRLLEEGANYERALSELESLIKAYPSERQGFMAQMAAARICLKRLSRPEDAVKFYQAAAASPVPHLDLEHAISAGLKEAMSAKGGATRGAAAGTF